eukprot:TCONS_00058397-protein
MSGCQRTPFTKALNFIGIGTTSSTSYYSGLQSFVVPTIQQEYDEEISGTIKEIKDIGTDTVVGGDCQMDFPGYSATKGTYSFCDTVSGRYLVHILVTKERSI